MAKPYPFERGDYVISMARHLRGKTFQVTVIESDTHVICVELSISPNAWAVNHDATARRLLRAELREVCSNHPSAGDPECHVTRKRGLHEGTHRIVA